MSSQTVVVIQTTQYVLLYIAHDMRLAQIIQADLTKPGEHARDRFALTPCGTDEEEPGGEEGVVSGKKF